MADFLLKQDGSYLLFVPEGKIILTAGPATTPQGGDLLNEDGTFLLLEDGSKILLEGTDTGSVPPPPPILIPVPLVQTLSPLIQVFILDVGTGNLFEIPFSAITIIEELNNGKQATLSLDFSSVKAVADIYRTTVRDLFAATFREIYVTSNSTKIFSGVAVDYSRSKDASGTYQLTVAAVDYVALLQKRRTGLTPLPFVGVDPASIPWQLINASQLSLGAASDFGITLGRADTTGQSISIEYKNAELKQEIVNLSNYKQINSFDFDIDLTKKLNVYYPFKGTLRSNIVLDDANILASTVKIPLLLNMTNSVFVMGQGINTDQAAVNRQSASAIVGAYKLLEDTISDITLSDDTLLNAAGDRHLSLNQLPLNNISLKHHASDPDITTYDVGDFLIVSIPDENINYEQYRVKKRTLEIDQSSNVQAQLDMLLL